MTFVRKNRTFYITYSGLSLCSFSKDIHIFLFLFPFFGDLSARYSLRLGTMMREDSMRNELLYNSTRFVKFFVGSIGLSNI